MMKITTGMEPVITKWAVPKREKVTMTIHDMDVNMPLSTLQAGEVWVVEFRKGNKLEAGHLCATQPVVNKRQVKLFQPSEMGRKYYEQEEEWARERHDIPSDAVVEDQYDNLRHARERTLTWWIVEI